MTPSIRSRRRLVTTDPGWSDLGSTDVVGMALLAPAMIGLALVILFLGRGVDSRATTHGAAESAAHAAARARSAPAAVAAARQVGTAMLRDARTCADPVVSVDVGDFRPGGVVSVTVRCRTSDAGLELVATGRGWRASATAAAVVDRYRSAEAGP